jgi:hypothetical protein
MLQNRYSAELKAPYGLRTQRVQKLLLVYKHFPPAMRVDLRHIQMNLNDGDYTIQ